MSLCIESNGPLPNLVTVEIARGILAGIDCAHRQGVYHRDIKPANIMVDRAGNVKIMDFGIAHIVNSESITMTGSFVGSAHYISPEQAEGGPLTGKTDIFSLGILLYQCLTGKLPFDAGTPHGIVNAIINDTHTGCSRKRSDVLFWLSDLIDRCMTKNPEKRPDSRDVLGMLNAGCEADRLRGGRGILIEYMRDPKGYARQERRLLFNAYRSTALDMLGNGQVAPGLRKLEQARAFGEIPADDLRFARKVTRTRGLRYAALTAALAIVVSVAAVVVVRNALGSRRLRPATARAESIGTPSIRSGRLDTVAVTPIQPADSALPLHNATLVRAGPVRTSGVSEHPAQDTARPLSPGRRHNDDAIAKVSQPGFLNIQTNPPWVRVSIDGIERGMTPKVDHVKLEPGLHTLSLHKKGFGDHNQRLSISPAETTSLRIRLQRPPGTPGEAGDGS